MNTLISIDIGYSNLAMVVLETNFIEFKVKGLHTVNLKDYNESQVHLNLKKFINSYDELFYNANLILIERQPPVGLTNIQDVIAYNYSSKVKIICPRSMHKHFMISNLNYELRKKNTIKIADSYLENFDIYKENMRKHDLADALCLGLYYFQINKKIENKLNNFLESFEFKDPIKFIESFEFKNQ
jgi:hypothetical protein